MPAQLKIMQAKLGPDHLDVATSLANLANLYRAMGRFADAKPLCLRSLRIRETWLGPDHPDVAKSLNDLAKLYMQMGQSAKAEPLYQCSLNIGMAKLWFEHPTTAEAFRNLAILHELERSAVKVKQPGRDQQPTDRQAAVVAPTVSQ